MTNPDWKSEIGKRLAELKLEPAREIEIIDELAQHLDDRYAELLAGGATEEEACHKALAELSDAQLLAQELKRVEEQVELEPVVLGAGRMNMIADLWQDLRYAVLGIRTQALLSTVVIATLALGIGISSGAFAFCNAQLLRPPLSKDFDSYVLVYSGYSKDPARPSRPGATTLEDYVAFRDRAKSLHSLAGWAWFSMLLGEEDKAEVRGSLVTPGFFSLFDVERPVIGRVLRDEDFSAASPVVVLSETLWRSRFVSDPQIVGKILHFNGQPVTAVGVVPAFGGMADGARVWFPYTLESYLKTGDNLRRPDEAAWLEVAGRLNKGFSHEDAAAELRLVAAQQDTLHPGRTTTLTVTDGSIIQDPQVRSVIVLALAVIFGVLVIFVMVVCVNVTTLLLSRAAARRHEIAVRLALGAGRARLVRMLLTESLLLAALAGVASVYLAYYIPGVLDYWLVSTGGGEGRGQYGVWWSPPPDWRVFGYMTLVTILAGTMAGLTPALQSMKVNLSETLKGVKSSTGGARSRRVYGLLIGAQVGLSFFLLCAAGFFVRSYMKAASLGSGFETRQIIWTRLTMPPAQGASQQTWSVINRALDERFAALPGVQSVAHSNFSFQGKWMTEVQASGQRLRPVDLAWVSPSYFSSMGIPIVSGRAIRQDDLHGGRERRSAVVSWQFAREFWPNQNALGQTLRDSEGNSFDVVGVAGDVSILRLGGKVEPMLYLPWSPNGPANLFVRASSDGGLTANVVASTIRDIAPELMVTAGTAQSLRERQMDAFRRATQVIAFLGVMSVVLAVIGIYGVVAFSVRQRSKEIGVRIALGAGKKDIYRAVLASSGRPVIIGLLLGLCITAPTVLTVAPSLSELKNMNVGDPITYLVTAALLGGVALAAMVIPARRATHVDPIDVLRFE